MPIDSKAITRWERARSSYDYYMTFLHTKQTRTLSLLDLIFVSNFKGGNATVCEPQGDIPAKLQFYDAIIEALFEGYGRRHLGALKKTEVDQLASMCDQALALTCKSESNILGFGPSRVSALLHFHFPDLIPILDRRALNGAGIRVEVDSQKQVIRMEQHYGSLIRYCHARLRANPGLSLHTLDHDLFAQVLAPPFC